MTEKKNTSKPNGSGKQENSVSRNHEETRRPTSQTDGKVNRGESDKRPDTGSGTRRTKDD
ncbi:MAG: hypothetical protein INF48_08400 [Rhodobacter sp.]|nr:hypothetical protein [Rhodobacter sp.]